MNITVTYKIRNSESIVQIDRRQEVGAGLRMLRETGKIGDMNYPDFFRSAGLGKIVSVYCTFEEIGIYSGDILSSVD